MYVLFELLFRSIHWDVHCIISAFRILNVKSKSLVKECGFKCGWCGFNPDYPHWNYIDKVSNMDCIWFMCIYSFLIYCGLNVDCVDSLISAVYYVDYLWLLWICAIIVFKINLWYGFNVASFGFGVNIYIKK